MSGQKIIDGLKDALAGNFARVTIDGQAWERVDPVAKDTAIKMAHADCDRYRAEIARLQALVDEQIQAEFRARAEIARLTAELAQVRDILTDRENTITQLTAERDDARAAAAIHHEQETKWRELCQERTAERDALRKEVADLSTLLRLLEKLALERSEYR